MLKQTADALKSCCGAAGGNQLAALSKPRRSGAGPQRDAVPGTPGATPAGAPDVDGVAHSDDDGDEDGHGAAAAAAGGSCVPPSDEAFGPLWLALQAHACAPGAPCGAVPCAAAAPCGALDAAALRVYAQQAASAARATLLPPAARCGAGSGVDGGDCGSALARVLHAGKHALEEMMNNSMAATYARTCGAHGTDARGGAPPSSALSALLSDALAACGVAGSESCCGEGRGADAHLLLLPALLGDEETEEEAAARDVALPSYLAGAVMRPHVAPALGASAGRGGRHHWAGLSARSAHAHAAAGAVGDSLLSASEGEAAASQAAAAARAAAEHAPHALAATASAGVAAARRAAAAKSEAARAELAGLDLGALLDGEDAQDGEALGGAMGMDLEGGGPGPACSQDLHGDAEMAAALPSAGGSSRGGGGGGSLDEGGAEKARAAGAQALAAFEELAATGRLELRVPQLALQDPAGRRQRSPAAAGDAAGCGDAAGSKQAPAPVSQAHAAAEGPGGGEAGVAGGASDAQGKRDEAPMPVPAADTLGGSAARPAPRPASTAPEAMPAAPGSLPAQPPPPPPPLRPQLQARRAGRYRALVAAAAGGLAARASHFDGMASGSSVQRLDGALIAAEPIETAEAAAPVGACSGAGTQSVLGLAPPAPAPTAVRPAGAVVPLLARRAGVGAKARGWLALAKSSAGSGGGGGVARQQEEADTGGVEEAISDEEEAFPDVNAAGGKPAAPSGAGATAAATAASAHGSAPVLQRPALRWVARWRRA